MKYIDPKTIKLVDLVRDNKKVYFAYYRAKEFWYKHEDGFYFPIPLSEVDDPASRATLPAEDKAIYYMRWMKRHLIAIRGELGIDNEVK